MNVRQEWLNTFLLSLTFTICTFIVIDSAYEDPFWEFSSYALKLRFQTFCLALIFYCLAGYAYHRLAPYFIKKNKDKKRTNRKEYAFIFLVNFIFINIEYFLMVSFIIKEGLKWKELLLNYVVGSALLLLFYMIIRNRILLRTLFEQSLQLEKVKVDQLDTELKFLKSQYHPHFLFNALNTIYFQVDEKNREAKQSIELLSALLRYQLYDIEQEVTMEQEINYLKSYIAFQQLRMTERLVLDVYFDPALREQKIHPLLFQPLIENAFKYVRGEYKIELEMKSDGNRIRFEIRNSISRSPNTNNKEKEGIGIENLKRRLDLLYPDKYSLEINQTESEFVVKLTMKSS
ncbi:MAG: histidine kinase [Prevotella sp.]|nr:histidine kinase [Prevotella sp.]